MRDFSDSASEARPDEIRICVRMRAVKRLMGKICGLPLPPTVSRPAGTSSPSSCPPPPSAALKSPQLHPSSKSSAATSRSAARPIRPIPRSSNASALPPNTPPCPQTFSIDLRYSLAYASSHSSSLRNFHASFSSLCKILKPKGCKCSPFLQLVVRKFASCARQQVRPV
jgi:hypothetical protein